MAGLRLTWFGDRVKDRMLDAAVGALDETAEAAAGRARAQLAGEDMPYSEGRLPDAVDVIDRAERGHRRAWVHWGVDDSAYADEEDGALGAFFHEIGANGVPGEHFLRNAADEEHPKLAKRIKKRVR